MKRAWWSGLAVLTLLLAPAAGAWAQERGTVERAQGPEAMRKMVQEEMARMRAEIREMVRDEVRKQLAESKEFWGGTGTITLMGPDGVQRILEPGPKDARIFVAPGDENVLRWIEEEPAEGDRGWLGVMIADVPPAELAELGLEATGGVRVTSVVEDSPAEAAGLQSGDIVIRLDKKTAGSAGELAEMVGARKAGQKVKLEIRRGSETRTLAVTLGARPEEMEIEEIEEIEEVPRLEDLESAEPAIRTAAKPYLGITIQDLDEETMRERGASQGVIVLEVRPGTPTAKLLHTDDVIVKVDGKAVTGVDALADQIAAMSIGEPVQFEVLRDGSKATFVIRLGGRAVVEEGDEDEGEEEAEEAEEHEESGDESGIFVFEVPGQKPAAFLGVNFGEVGPVVAERLGLDPGEGVLVQGVVEGSAAEKAGLREGDVLIAINDAKLVGTESLPAVIGSFAPGDTVVLTWGREGETRTTRVTLGARPGEMGLPQILEVPLEGLKLEPVPPAPPAPAPPKVLPPERREPAKAPGYLGVEVSPVSDDVRKVLGIAEGEGLVIDRVVEGSPASTALEAYDVVLRVGGAPVATREALAEKLAKAGAGTAVELELLRQGKKMTVTLTLGSR